MDFICSPVGDASLLYTQRTHTVTIIAPQYTRHPKKVQAGEHHISETTLLLTWLQVMLWQKSSRGHQWRTPYNLSGACTLV